MFFFSKIFLNVKNFPFYWLKFSDIYLTIMFLKLMYYICLFSEDNGHGRLLAKRKAAFWFLSFFDRVCTL